VLNFFRLRLMLISPLRPLHGGIGRVAKLAFKF
jgi:hypothetical protein